MHRALALSFVVGASLMPAAQAAPEPQELVGKVSIIHDNWRHSGKFLIVDITFRNDNSFSLQDVIAPCHINGDPARPQDSRSVTIRNWNHHQGGWL
jgi:hypothetical protein